MAEARAEALYAAVLSGVTERALGTDTTYGSDLTAFKTRSADAGPSDDG